MSENEISHKGVIREIGPADTIVEIVSASACGACHAAGLCTMAEAVKKDVVVPTDASEHYRVGEEVEVVLRKSMGMKAVWISYVIPLAILLVLVVSLSYTSLHELVIAAIGLGGMAIYYFIVWLFRDRLSSEYVFTIRRV